MPIKKKRKLTNLEQKVEEQGVEVPVEEEYEPEEEPESGREGDKAASTEALQIMLGLVAARFRVCAPEFAVVGFKQTSKGTQVMLSSPSYEVAVTQKNL